MILIVCPRCPCALRVTGDTDEAHFLVGQVSDFWPDKFRCFRCDGPAYGALELEFEKAIPLDVIEVSPQEAFAAIHGLGLPTEQECTKETLELLLREQPIKRISGKNMQGLPRCWIDYLELWDGSKIYLGASAEGALVYKITRPHSYTKQVEDVLT